MNLLSKVFSHTPKAGSFIGSFCEHLMDEGSCALRETWTPCSTTATNSETPGLVGLLVGFGSIAAYTGVCLYVNKRRRDASMAALPHIVEDRVHAAQLAVQADTTLLAPVATENMVAEEVVVPAVLDAEGEVQTPEVRQTLVQAHGPFVARVVTAGKMKFGGVPKPTEANKLAVWRFVVNQCENRKLNPTQAKNVVSLAVPLVFIPDEDDLASISLCSSEITRRQLARKAAITHRSELDMLINSPLNGKRWINWVRSIVGLSDKEVLRFAK